ncbi:MAG: MBL fold metallo-hydrolase [Treponemataceae bacterium]|nr:MBL fold metallo-hydrolase [Treponemataceae bacterium]
MDVKFWGVRGSLAAPLLPEQVQAKINAAVQIIQPKDLESQDARQKFLSSLPPYVYGTIGGNTPCVQVTSSSNDVLIFDAGTGMRALGLDSRIAAVTHYSLFLSHLHWDHIQGFPFFGPLYDSNVTIDIYSPVEDIAEMFARQMRAPFYPVDFNVVKDRIKFNVILPGKECRVGGVTVVCCKMNHPGDSYSYSVEEDGKKVVYATDIELSDFEADDDVKKVFGGADVAILDSQYTPQDALGKSKWGHSAFSYALDFAVEMNVKKMYLFHYDPSYDDKKVNSIFQSAKMYSKSISTEKLEVELAIEGKSFSL